MVVAAETRAAAIAKLQEELDARLAPYRTHFSPGMADPRPIQTSQITFHSSMASNVESSAAIAKLQEVDDEAVFRKYFPRSSKSLESLFLQMDRLVELVDRYYPIPENARDSKNIQRGTHEGRVRNFSNSLILNHSDGFKPIHKKEIPTCDELHVFDKSPARVTLDKATEYHMIEATIEEKLVVAEESKVFAKMSELNVENKFAVNVEVLVSDDGQLMNSELPIIKEVSESDEVSEGFELDEFSEKFEYVSEQLKVSNETDSLFELSNEENGMLKLPLEKKLLEIEEIMDCGDMKGLATVETPIKAENKIGKQSDLHELFDPVRGIFTNGMIFDLGKFKWLVEQAQSTVVDIERAAVVKIARLLARFRGDENHRIWIIETAACETHLLRCQVYHHVNENDWNVKVVPIALSSLPVGICPRFDIERLLSNSTSLLALSVLENSNHVRDELLEMLLPLPEPPPGSYFRIITALVFEDSLDAWLKMLHRPPELALASNNSMAMQADISQPVGKVLKSTRLKEGEFPLKLCDLEGASLAFLNGIQLFKNLLKVWISLGNYYDMAYRESQEDDSLEYAVSSFLEGTKFGIPNSRSYLERVLYFLSFDTFNESVGRVFDKYLAQISHWVGLSWVTRLLLTLRKTETSHGKLVSLEAANVYSWALYYWLRSYLLEHSDNANKSEYIGIAMARQRMQRSSSNSKGLYALRQNNAMGLIANDAMRLVASAASAFGAAKDIMETLSSKHTNLASELESVLIEFFLVEPAPALFPPEYAQEFRYCFDKVPSVSFQYIPVIIWKELGKHIDSVVEYVDPMPLATASLARVHGIGIMGTQGEVVTKILKPGIEDILVCLNFVHIIARILEFLSPDLGRVSLVVYVKHKSESMLEAGDFMKEAKNVELFRKYLEVKGLPMKATTPIYKEIGKETGRQIHELFNISFRTLIGGLLAGLVAVVDEFTGWNLSRDPWGQGSFSGGSNVMTWITRNMLFAGKEKKW